jgi:hypothetical protein
MRIRRGLHGLVILVVFLLCFAAERVHASTLSRVTYYVVTGNPTASGEWPYVGSCACSYMYPLGTQFLLPDGWVVTCNDRGMLTGSWVDIFVPSTAWGQANVAEAYGSWADVEIVRYGW